MKRKGQSMTITTLNRVAEISIEKRIEKTINTVHTGTIIDTEKAPPIVIRRVDDRHQVPDHRAVLRGLQIENI